MVAVHFLPTFQRYVAAAIEHLNTKSQGTALPVLLFNLSKISFISFYFYYLWKVSWPCSPSTLNVDPVFSLLYVLFSSSSSSPFSTYGGRISSSNLSLLAPCVVRTGLSNCDWLITRDLSHPGHGGREEEQAAFTQRWRSMHVPPPPPPKGYLHTYVEVDSWTRTQHWKCMAMEICTPAKAFLPTATSWFGLQVLTIKMVPEGKKELNSLTGHKSPTPTMSTYSVHNGRKEGFFCTSTVWLYSASHHKTG